MKLYGRKGVKKLNENLENKKNPKTTGMKVLELVQILYQNEDIDARSKNNIVGLTKDGMKTGNFAQLNAYFKSLQYGITMSDTLIELLNLTS